MAGADRDHVSGPPTPAPRTGPPWPDRESLAGTGVVLARPDPVHAPAVYRMVADPALWVDVPPQWRTRSVAAQRDELAFAATHWDLHGFGYWLAWEAHARPADEAVGDDLVGMGGLRWLWWRDGWVLNVLVRLAARAQGRGLARRMLSLAIDRLDGALEAASPVVVRTRPGNAAMAGLAHRLGFDDAGSEEREMGTYRVLVRRIGR